MQISPINNAYSPIYKTKTSQSIQQPAFEGQLSKQLTRAKSEHGLEYGMRVIGNKISNLFTSRANKQLVRTIAAITPERTRLYLEQLVEIGRLYGTQKVIDVNIEDGVLQRIAKTDEATIFVMTHSNQSEDPQMLAVLNTLLAEAYKEAGKNEFPIPKIILNEDILKTMDPIKRKAFENFGAVGLDASVIGGDKTANSRAFLPLVRDFVKDKCNIFIFPEGRLAVRKDLELYDRFQPGVASLINKMLSLKKSVRVVPVGFAYGSGDNKSLTAMNIGEPIIIKRKEGATTITKGDIEKAPDSDLYGFIDAHKSEEDIVITSGGVPVAANEVTDYLKTILCENLEINEKFAKARTEIPLDDSEVQLY